MGTKNRTDELRIVDDEEIIELYWKRDEQAISQTDKKYRRYLFTIAYNILHDNMDCDECLNDTYLKTWNKIPPTRPRILQLFLSKITRDVSVDKYRENNLTRKIPSELMLSLDELDEWRLDSVSEVMYSNEETDTEGGLPFTFCTYKKTN